MTNEEMVQIAQMVAQASAKERDEQVQRGIDEGIKAHLTNLAETEVRAGMARFVPGSTKEPAQVKRVEKFATLGEQMQAVVGAKRGRWDSRLIPFDTVEHRAATGLNETTGSEGAFLVQEDFSAELITNIHDAAMIFPRTTQVQISAAANSLQVNGVDETSRTTGNRWGGIRGYWTAEAGTKTASEPTFRRIEFLLKKLIVLIYSTDELLQDASALQAVLTQGATEEFTWFLDSAVIRGTGAGQPLGILNSPATVSVAAEAGQQAASIVIENIFNMWARMVASSIPRSAWYINQDVWPQLLALSLAVGTGGGPAYMPPATGISGAPFGTLLGRPIFPVEACSTLGTVGDIIFADMSKYWYALKGGLQTDMSIHVRFVNDETVFRWVMRVDGKPIWSSALTPSNGTNTQSPFITLATRS